MAVVGISAIRPPKASDLAAGGARRGQVVTQRGELRFLSRVSSVRMMKSWQRHWHLFDILRAKSEARLPAILSGAEVRGILRCVRKPRNHAFLSTVYACGLRLQEAQHP